MATREGIEIHRAIQALLVANENGDEDGVIALLGMYRLEGPALLFLAELVDLVRYAFDFDAAEGWEAFIARYAAAIDAADG